VGQQSSEERTEADAMFPSTSELAFQYKQSTWYQAVTKDLGAERAAGRKKYYVPTYYLLARTFSFTTRALAHHRLSFYGAAQKKENAIKPDSVGVSIIAQVWILILRYSRLASSQVHKETDGRRLGGLQGASVPATPPGPVLLAPLGAGGHGLRHGYPSFHSYSFIYIYYYFCLLPFITIFFLFWIIIC
jgi:hypothetical protein